MNTAFLGVIIMALGVAVVLVVLSNNYNIKLVLTLFFVSTVGLTIFLS